MKKYRRARACTVSRRTPFGLTCLFVSFIHGRDPTKEGNAYVLRHYNNMCYDKNERTRIR